MKRVVTFGELMLRLAPNGYYRFFQNDQMQATFGGGEANVAVSLANYGMECCECGCCSYICPAKRNLTHSIKSMRKDILASRKK